VLTEVIGDLLPSALGVAISPLPIIGVVLMLSSDRARSQGPAFALGWVAALTAVSVVIGSLAQNATGDGDPSPLVARAEVLFGVLFLGLAAERWRARREMVGEPESPAWMASLGTLSTARTAALGAALAGLNPKNLALTAAAGGGIGQAGLSGPSTALATAVFVVIGSSTVLGPVLFRVLAPRRSEVPLERMRRFMAQHDDAIVITVLLLLGAKLLGNGIAAL
jgi:hypothetical protein